MDADVGGGDCIDLDGERSAYRAEGNANLVLSLDDRGTVLRVRKSINCMVAMGATVADDNGDAARHQHNQPPRDHSDATAVRRTVDYIEAISNLFAGEFVVTPRIVRLRCRDWTAFNRRLQSQRPVHRLDKHVCGCNAAVLYPDVARLPDAFNRAWVPSLSSPSSSSSSSSTKTSQTKTTAGCQQPLAEDWQQVDNITYAVEIKPKQGWWTADAVHDDDGAAAAAAAADVDDGGAVAKCRFCCMQFLKLQKGKIQTRSLYCPLDLFSGCKRRTQRALSALVAQPQNNLRIFTNGNLLYGDRVVDRTTLDQHFASLFRQSDAQSNLQHFTTLLAHALYAEFEGCDTAQWATVHGQPLPDRSPTDGCDTVAQGPLPERCVLRSVLDVQRLLAATLHSVRAPPSTAEADDIAHIDDILAQMRSRPHANDLSDAARYVLGATALDCSIMITFRRLPDAADVDRLSDVQRRHLIGLTTTGSLFATQVTIIDLDPKHLSKHRRKYAQQLRQSRAAQRAAECGVGAPA